MAFCTKNAYSQSSNSLDPSFLDTPVTIKSAPVIVLDANENIIEKTYGDLRIEESSSELMVWLNGVSNPKGGNAGYFLLFDKSCKCTRKGDVTKGNDVLELSKHLSDGHETLVGLVSSSMEGAPEGYNKQLYIADIDASGNMYSQVVVALTGEQYIHALIYIMKEVKDRGLVPFTQYY